MVRFAEAYDPAFGLDGLEMRSCVIKTIYLRRRFDAILTTTTTSANESSDDAAAEGGGSSEKCVPFLYLLNKNPGPGYPVPVGILTILGFNLDLRSNLWLAARGHAPVALAPRQKWRRFLLSSYLSIYTRTILGVAGMPRCQRVASEDA